MVDHRQDEGTVLVQVGRIQNEESKACSRKIESKYWEKDVHETRVFVVNTSSVVSNAKTR